MHRITARSVYEWQTRYKVALALLAAAYIAMGAWLLQPPRSVEAVSIGPEVQALAAAGAFSIKDLPVNPEVGDTYWTPTRTRYIYPRTYEVTTFTRAVNWSSNWQTTSTWPQGRIAEQTRYQFRFTSNGWRYAETFNKATGLFNLWGIQCNIKYRYNFNNIYSDNSNRCFTWGIGFPITFKAVTWNEGGRYYGYLEYGADFTVSVAIEGAPIHFAHWIRHAVWKDGTSGAMTGA